MHAYDYAAQEWVEGRAARVLLKRYLDESTALALSPRGEEYARMSDTTVATIVTANTDALRDLAALPD
jgi:hypothetical protein